VRINLEASGVINLAREIKMKQWFARISVVALLLIGLSTQPAGATTLALEGSDATGFHQDTTYTAQLFSFLKEGSGLPVFVYNPDSPLTLDGAPSDTTYGSVLPGTLTGVYSAVYIQAAGGCCSENDLSAGDQAAIAAFYAGGTGGSVSIQNYEGLNAGITGFTPGALDIGGLVFSGTGGAGGPGCFDTEVFLPGAISKGFSQPPSLGCWGHQAYDNAFFGPKGFLSLVDSGPEFAELGSGSWSSFLALGGSLGTPVGVPEPTTLLLLGSSLIGLAAARRRSKA
jgi:hypothetical protein